MKRKHENNMCKRKVIHTYLLTLGLLTLLPSIKVDAQPPGIPDGWSDGYVYANGIRIHYYHAVPAPGKPVIVMVHGVTDIGLCWTTLTLDPMLGHSRKSSITVPTRVKPGSLCLAQ